MFKKLILFTILLALFFPAIGQDNEYRFLLSNTLRAKASGGSSLPADAAGYLLNNGTGTLSWGAISFVGYLRADGTVPLTANWPMGAFTLSQATWQGVAIAAPYGGTGQTSYAVGDLLYAPTTSTIGKLADVAVGQVLTSGGVGVAPAWSGNPSVASLALTGTGTLASTLGNVSLTTALTAANGNEAALTLNYTTNKAAGNDTGLVVNMTDTASPGTSLLADFQVATVSKFSVNNTGLVTAPYIAVATSLLSSASNSTLVIQDIGSRVFSGTVSDDAVEMAGATNTKSAGTYCAVAIIPTHNATSTNAATDLLINRTESAVGSGTQRLLSAQVGSVEKAAINNKGAITSTMINNTDSDTDEIDSVTWAGGYGMVIAASTTDGTSAIWKLEGTTFTAISVDADWTAIQNNASTYNVYFDSGAIKLQNKVGDNKIVKLGYFGI